MFQRLVSHNEDLRRLADKGYALAIDSNCLIVRDIPYLDAAGELRWGAFVAKLVFADQEHVHQDDHQVFFAGSPPHGLVGGPIPNLGGGPTQLALGDACRDVVVERSFSNKPKKGHFDDFFEKIESYTAIVSGPAIEKFSVTPFTFRAVKEVVPDSVFKFHDTLTSRAEISDLAAKFEDDVVAVIGLGGTGAYLLDFIVRTRINAIRGFDPDMFYVHNAYRSPGRTEEAEFNTRKAEVYESRYSNFRHNLSIEPTLIDSNSGDALEGVTFAFVCVDKGSSRAGIFDVLMAKGIPFIDVGMGLDRKQEALKGMLRVTHFSTEEAGRVRGKGLAELHDTEDDVYRTNIQTSELNALNACLAVIKYKQLRGFYLAEPDPDFHLLLGVKDLRITGMKLDEI